MPGILQLSNVTRRFDGVIAVSDLDLSVEKGTIHGLIGPNGSGKTTTFNLIAGELPVSSGMILFNGKPISGLPAHRRAGFGIARTFQSTELFGEFTVEENFAVAASFRHSSTFWHTLLNTAHYRGAGVAIAETVNRLTEMLGLKSVRRLLVRDLPHRHQKAVALGNALALEPELLMLDEPAAGLTHGEMEEMMSIYRSIQASGTTILFVEHNMRTVMGLCTRITVLNHGRKIAEGTPAEISSNPRVIEAYLGKARHTLPSARNVS